MVTGRTPGGGRRRAALLPVLLAALLGAALLAACSGSGGDQTQRGGVTTAGAPAPTSTPGGAASPALPTPADPAAVDWARAACTIAGAFIADFVATDDGVDPRTLSLDLRKQRAARQFPPQIAAATRAAEHMAELTPPPASAELHNLLRLNFADLARELSAQQTVVAGATTAEDIQASNRAVADIRDLVFRQAQLLQLTADCAAIGDGPA